MLDQRFLANGGRNLFKRPLASRFMKDKDAVSKEGKEGQDKASEMVLGGNIALVGFNILDQAELLILKKIIGGYVRKISNFGEYKEMKLSLQQHAHGKTFKHEVTGMVVFGDGRFNSNVTDWNLYGAVSQVCEKILQEVTHHATKKNDYKGPKNSETNLEGKFKR